MRVTDGCDMMANLRRTDPALPLLVLLLVVGSGAAVEPERQTNVAIPVKVWRYAERWVARCDADGDGRLTSSEWPQPDPNVRDADANRDGLLTVDELAQYIADFGRHRKIRLMPASVGGIVPLPSLLPPGGVVANRQETPPDADHPPAQDDATAEAADSAEDSTRQNSADRKYVVSPARLPPGLPDWFLKRDRDGDGQLTLSEYAEIGSASADREFAGYDRNRDGLITPREVLGPTRGTSRKRRPPAADSTPKPEPPAPEPEAKKAE